MTEKELKTRLNRLLNLHDENEVVEFKEAKKGFDFEKLGKYFSALSNEANLFDKDCAWLVFGVENKKHTIVGSEFRPNRADLDKLKKELADKISNRITFREIYELPLPEGRVILFQIPPAPRGLPVSFAGHYYGRDGGSLVALNIEEIERIRNQSLISDWSASLIPDATTDDLEPMAIKYAKERFLVKFPELKKEAATWNNVTFLNKAKITIKGKITRTAIILLGKSESEHFLIPFIAKIRWVLKTLNNEEKDYDIFSPPILLAIDKVFEKIRNLKYRYLPKGTLFPNEVLRYEPFNIREAVNNCVAHSDYSLGGYINIIEFEDDRLIFENFGRFIPGNVEKVVEQDSPEIQYRNPFLANAMFQLGLVDTRGGGIKKMFHNQIQRFFPLPEYELGEKKTKMTLTGKILDPEFAEILMDNPDLSLPDIFLLDKVQKKKNISTEELRYLRKLKLIEGRKHNIYLSFKVVKSTDDENLKQQYITNRSFDDNHFKEMILEYLKLGKAKRKAINELVIPKLSAALTEEQKRNKVTNYLASLRREEKIESLPGYYWRLT
ncbi:MAG: RNA-binding domain-containing protein [Chitinophagaceae bacterium]